MRNLNEFKQEFYKKFPNSKLLILNFSKRKSKKGYNNFVYIKNKYGVCEVSKTNLMSGIIPSILTAINKEQYLTNQIKEKYPENLKKFKIIKYNGKTNVIVKDNYGICISKSNNLINGNLPSIFTAINKLEYFHNLLIERYPNYQNFYKIVNYYNSKKVEVISKYGTCITNASELLQGSKPSIKSSINKTQFFKNIYFERFPNSSYDFTEFNYKGVKNKSKLICKEHGYFYICPNNLLNGTGCVNCKNKKLKENPTSWNKTNWFIGANNSKLFSSFKVYIIECWNEKERFYKIGRTFQKLEKRFYGKSNFPYNYKILQIFEFKELTQENANKAFDLENELKIKNKENKYLPKLNFQGRHECFKLINYE